MESEALPERRHLPEIPNSWIAFTFLFGMIVLRFYGIDSFVTGTLSGISMYLFGRHINQRKV